MRITIGVPFFNAAEYLMDCLRSIFAQSEQDWELLLVDDGSTDQSLEIAHSIDDPRVRVISDGCNRGLPTRLNQIAELARGALLARQDADDLMHPARLSEQATFLNEHRHFDAVGCSWIAINDRSEIVGRSRNRSLDLRPESILRHVPLSHCTVLGRREWFRKIPYDNTLRRAQDRDFWIRAILSEQSQVAFVDEARYFYRIPTMIPLTKTLAGYRNDRVIFRKFGRRHLGPWRTALRTCESYTKTGVWRLASRLRIDAVLANARSARIEPQDRQFGQHALEQILAQTVPIAPDCVESRAA